MDVSGMEKDGARPGNCRKLSVRIVKLEHLLALALSTEL